MKYVCLLLFFMFFWLPSVACADAQVKVDGQLVSLDVKDADLLSVLKEMETKTGVKITVGKEELIPGKITIQFNGKLEDAVKEIFQTNYALVYKSGEVKEIIILSASLPDNGYIRTVDLAYGDLISRNAMFGQGPESFAVDRKGNVYILDSLKNRVQVFSNRGAFLFTIPLPKEPKDIAISPDSGAILVLSRDMYLFQYDDKGQLVATIPVADRWRSAGAMYISGDKVFLNVYDTKSGNVVIGRFVNGKIMVPTLEQIRQGVENTFGGGGKKYRISNFEFRIGVDVEEIDRGAVVTTYHLKNPLSIRFIGEDDTGAAYFVTEVRDEAGTLVAEIHRLENGAIKTVRMLPSKIDTWSTKIYNVSSGTITQFLPESDKLRLNFYRVNP